MKPMKPQQAIWKREFLLARAGRHWRGMAHEQRSCAEFLEARVNDAIQGSMRGGGPIPPFFSPKFVRMLFGYSLENLSKGLLLASPTGTKFIKGTRDSPKISFNGQGHDLVWLLRELGISFPDRMDDSELGELPEEIRAIVAARRRGAGFYLRIWSVSAEWFGKYPYPAGEAGVLDEYESLTSSEALTRRVHRGKREVTMEDVLHRGIGEEEAKAYAEVFARLDAMWDRSES